MPLLTRKRVLLAKTETTYGTDSVPTGAANAILVSEMSITPLAGSRIDRDVIRPYFGANEQVSGSQYVTLEFSVEMQGSGTAGTAPGYDALLKACGMVSTVAAGTSVTYAPTSSSTPSSVTLYYNVDGVLHKITGARGNVTMSIAALAIPRFTFTFTGMYNNPADTALPTVDYTTFKTPLAANGDNTTGFSLHGYSAVMQSLEIDFGNSIEFRSLIGSESVQLLGRAVSGTAVFEAPTIAAKDYFSLAIGTTLGALDITHGTAAGSRVQVSSSRVSISNPTYTDQNGVQMLSVPFTCVPSSAGNDEISIIVR